MKRTIITFETDEDFKNHLDKKAKENRKSVSAYIRAALKAKTKYVEKLV